MTHKFKYRITPVGSRWRATIRVFDDLLNGEILDSEVFDDHAEALAWVNTQLRCLHAALR